MQRLRAHAGAFMRLLIYETIFLPYFRAGNGANVPLALRSLFVIVFAGAVDAWCLSGE
jgi:hypothetical protein